MKLYVDEISKQTAYHGVTCIYDNIEETIGKVQEGAIDFEVALKLKDHARGKQILLLFQTDGGTLLKESDLASIKEMVSEYDRLRASKR